MFYFSLDERLIFYVVVFFSTLEKGIKTGRMIILTSSWLERAEQSSSDSELLRTISKIMGLDLPEWKLMRDLSLKGKSGSSHSFDYVLQSIKTGTIIPVLNLREHLGDRYEKILMHRVMAADIEASSGVILISTDLEPKEKNLCDICNFTVFKTPVGNASHVSYNIGRSFATKILNIERDPTYTQSRNHSKRHNRDRTRITEEILDTVYSLEGASITQLIYKCNLNYKSAKEIMGELIKRELVKTERNGENNLKYEITDRGRRVLERLRVYEMV